MQNNTDYKFYRNCIAYFLVFVQEGITPQRKSLFVALDALSM